MTPPDQPNSEYQRYKKGYPAIMQVAEELIAYVYGSASPQAFPRMTCWLSKAHGSGRMDLYQNCLIVALAASSYFEKCPQEQTPVVNMHGTALYRCRRTGQHWLRTSYEFRMLAFQERLERHPPIVEVPIMGAPAPENTDLYSADFYATVGFEPPGSIRISLPEWKEFMLQPDGAGPAQ
ncbi:MAG: hypothetical protein KDK27_05910 [Leptospiraceae bacterium]|nr:hypothetical protein [Leptospiraceae bacterium]